MDFPKIDLSGKAALLAAQDIRVGTSSWRYRGWLGLIYTPGRYSTRGKFSLAKFKSTCLAEYAEIFKTVCLDGGFYQFPSAKIIEGYVSQVPADFRLSLKVTEDITVRRFSKLSRYKERAGQVNEHFLDADLFVMNFLGPLEPYRSQIGTLIFEFHFHAGDWERGRDFLPALDAFLKKLPKGWDYSVEVRNANLLQPEYFAVLHQHDVAHTFNNWERMPPVLEQMQLPDSFTTNFATARFLLTPGRTFNEAVKLFEPYSEVRDPNPEAREALTQLIGGAKPTKARRRYVYVSNRLEGCSLWTLYAVISGLLPKGPESFFQR